MSATPTRRAVLGLAIAPVAALALPTAFPPAKAASGDDAAILKAWKVRQNALAAILKRGPYSDAETHSPRHADAYDRADDIIVRATATTPKTALIKAWVAWGYQGQEFTARERKIHGLIRSADYAALSAMARDLDFNELAMLTLIGSLRALTGEARS